MKKETEENTDVYVLECTNDTDTHVCCCAAVQTQELKQVNELEL